MRLTNANGQTKTLWNDLPILLPITLILSLSCLPTTWALSDKRLCADEKCEQIISMGTTKLSYNSGEDGMLAFKINTPVRIMSKSAGSNPSLWGVEINGRRGYANKNFIREQKIFINEKNLKHELLVQGLPQLAVQNPTIVNNPTTEGKQEPTADSVQSAEQQQPVLNSSELVDDLSTTTTSPLETLKLSILTEQDQTGSSETSTPITPAQANLQVVDGSELPLEVVPATTERIPNNTNLPIAEQAEVEEFQTTTTSEDNYDYEEDDENSPDEENNDEPTVDTKLNEGPSEAAKAINAVDSKVIIDIQAAGEQVPMPIAQQSVEEVPAVPKLVNTETLNQAAIQEAAQLDSLHEAKQPEIVDITATNNVIPAEAVAEAAPEAIQNNNAVPATDLNLQPKQEATQSDKALPAATDLNLQPVLLKQEISQPVLTELEIKDQTNQVMSEENPAIKDNTQTTTDTQQIPIATEAPIDIQQPKVEAEPTIQQLLETQPTAQEDIVNQDSQTVQNDIQNSVEDIKNNDLSVDIEAPKATELSEPQLNEKQPSNIYTEVPEVKAEQVPEGNEAQPSQAQAEASITESQTLRQEAQAAAPTDIIVDELNVELIKNETEFLQGAAEKDIADTVATAPIENDAQLKHEANEVDATVAFEAQPATENIETAPNKIDEAVGSTEEPFKTASMPPLFKNQHFHNPNEYYKQLQDQQQRLANEAVQQQQPPPRDSAEQQQQLANEAVQQQPPKDTTEQQQQLANEAVQQQQQPPRDTTEQLHHSDSLAEQHTTPNPTTFDVYDAAYDAEPTPATPIRDSSEQIISTGTAEPLGLPSLSAESVKEDVGLGAGAGLFSTIMGTVNSFMPSQSAKKSQNEPLKDNDELHRLLYPDAEISKDNYQAEGHCERPMDGNCHAAISLDNFVDVLLAKVLDNSLVLLCVVIAAASSLFFIFVYYCFCNSSQEGALLAKLNHLERSLLASHKENLIVKNELTTTRTKLSSIEDNSFGSNDMVVALKKQLETELYEKAKLQEQVNTLEKDLDNAAEAGLELNKMLSEVLNSQNGDEAFMSTVEELQGQLNDQEKIIIEINASLAEKSRENSELQYTYTEATARLTSEMKSLQQDNYELEMEKSKLQTRIEQVQAETEHELAKALEARNYEMQRLQHQIMELNSKYEREHSELQTSLAKIEALEECLKALKKDSNANVQELISSAKSRGELNATKKKFASLKAKLEQEVSAKVRLENQLQISSDEVEQLKQSYNQSESDKLEAQTRLEVLSGYFREKETQLQKELSLQEAKWLQHQGENASTVETQTLMKNEIQTLKSQNDELRAEIEAQIASHKAQMGTLENRAHESWLAARQSERRSEEALAEAAGLRRKLTAMASGVGGALSDVALDALPANGGGVLGAELNPSPLPLPLPGSPGLLNMPNPLPFLSTPFSPFMGLPPPFLPPAAVVGVARPPPLGRMRSPPPTSSSRGGDRYSPHRDDHDDRDDYSDYDDYDDDEEDERGMERRRRLSGSWGRSHRDSYMHSPRTYRSLSPSDSRYNYNDTETDFSPPPSPPPPRKGGSRPINEV